MLEAHFGGFVAFATAIAETYIDFVIFCSHPFVVSSFWQVYVRT